MSKTTNTPNLEQWRILQAVVDSGGYAQAAERLQKSQSTLSYSLRRLQDSLGIELLEIQGRRAMLTSAGESLLRRARRLLDDAQALENTAQVMAQGWESDITLDVDVITPKSLVLKALSTFEREHPDTRLEIVESALSGTQDAIVHGRADVVVSGMTPPGFLGSSIGTIEMHCVAHRDHPLAGQELVTEFDLSAHRQIVVRDSGNYRRIDTGWLGAEKRWTVNDFNHSRELVVEGLGFAWIPFDHISQYLSNGDLVKLPLKQGGHRQIDMKVFYPKRERTGPAARYLGELLSDTHYQVVK
jgi:DNA-binding transcriptional LysR family regulator